ncbi:MAG: UDP-3-O-(3-hydroxymyristoyl)glucosamine N-acyltransferase [Planctomycetia bacterium]|nr:UDP-3-O-(3-hydroxymyristoyl)glucosamine N-acyltransferase [Planctomycetia bacterium]
MKATLSELAALVNGRLLGEPSQQITEVAPIHAAKESSISFLSNVNKTSLLQGISVGALIVPNDFHSDEFPQINLIKVDHVLDAFGKIASFFRPPRLNIVQGISPLANIDASASLGKNVQIASGVSIGKDVVLGDHCVLYPGVVILDGSVVGDSTILFPNVVLYENTIIGKNCLLHANCVIGAYGFGYDSSNGTHQLSAQLGCVEIEDEVEIGACSTVDRGTYGTTKIGYGTKIDNHVMIAHNCQIGRYNLICASVGIAGSTTTGDYVVMAGRVGIRDHIHIGSGAVLGAMAGIMANVPEKARVVGIPATPEKEQMKKQVALSKLPEMRREMKSMQAAIAKLSNKIESESP